MCRLLLAAAGILMTLLTFASPAAAQVKTGVYTGKGADNRTITGIGFRPDVVIIKANGAQVARIRTASMPSTDPSYGGLNAADVSATNRDEGAAGITVSAISGDTTEAGGTATFTVVLNSEPTADVTIALSSSDTTEGTVSPASLTFTAATWNTPQTVTATGVDDLVDDGDQSYTVVTAAATSTDPSYGGRNAADVSVTNRDNDAAGITVSAISGDTTEAGGTATFTVVLNSEPTADVAIALSSSDTTEGTVSPTSLTFTAATWNIARTVTVTGVDDPVDDGDQPYTIVTAAATSTDPSYGGLNAADVSVYGGLNAADVSVTNRDNDNAGFTVSAVSGDTTETGGTATFTVVLTSAPTADVTLALSSSDTSEGTVSPASLTFTVATWNTPQTVTVRGVDDLVDDGDQAYTVVTAAATSTDPSYGGLNAADVTVTNRDNDNAGFTVSAVSGDTTETGGNATFTVVLTSAPTADVTLALSSSDTSEGTVSPASLTFTAATWNTAQTVTVTGADDLVDDGDQIYTVVTAAATSTDPSYGGLNAADVTVTNRDNDNAGITVSAISGDTTEAGGTATFTVVLNSEPTADVAIALSSSDTTEGTVSPTSLTFTAATWNIARTVTVTGVDDPVDDGDQPYTVVTAAATSTDPTYSGRDAADVSATNHDNDNAGITVSAISGDTTEAGGTATFTVVLDSEPTADVTVAFYSGDKTEGTVSPASLTFTGATWNIAQTVTVTGADDLVDDGDQSYTVVTAAATSTDPSYGGLNAADVSVTNRDNDNAGITVSAISGDTTEGGGTATFTVVLDSEPTADVTLALSSSDTAEGTVSPTSLTFTAATWNTPQTVTVTGVGDLVDDGNQSYTIVIAAATSTDTTYSGRDAADVSATNRDDDNAGITVSAVSGDTTEVGGSATFTVVLDSEPTADVTLALSSSDTAEGTVSPASLTFTAATWNTPQTVTVTGVDDPADDGDQPYTVVTAAATSTDPTYSGRDPADVSATNRDDDNAGITVSAISGDTTEAGGTATFTVVLDSEPTADVTIALSSSNTAEGTVSPASLTFTAATWNIAQTVTVTGVDDPVDDGDQPYTVVTAAATSTDPNYGGRDPGDVSATNRDNDNAGITVSAVSGDTTEAGGTATFTVVLDSEPNADVTLALSSSDTAEGTVSPASLTFSAATWNTAQTVTLTGVDDLVDDGDQSYTVVTAAATSTDPSYGGLNAADVSATNRDNDAAGFTVSAMSGDTTEAGGTASFTVVLNSQPTADVTIALSSSDTAEGTVSLASLTFTAATWSSPQTVTLTGVDDLVDDGDQAYTIVTAAATSTDPSYGGLNAADVSATNRDDDNAGITVSAISGDTTEAGGTATFTVVLESEPTADVTIALSSSDTAEGTVSPALLTFTAATWNIAQTVTATGVDDLVDDGDQSYTVVIAAAISTDTTYSGRNAADVSATNRDDDNAGITVSAVSGDTTEAGGTATFTVVLDSQPTADVTIALSSSDTAEGNVGPVGLTFTPETWNTAQTITVTGVDDSVDDGDQVATVVTAPATSTDPNYDGRNAADVSVTNLDDDAAGITVSALSGETTEAGGTATFTVVLDSQPTADVTLALSSSDTGEGTVSPMSLTFTAATWNIAQTVTATGVDDPVDDGDQPYTVVTAAATSTDPNYGGRDPGDVSATNRDNDNAGMTVSAISGDTTEAGGTATFTVVLDSQPTADVNIALSSSDTAEGTVSPALLTFTAATWSTAQTVTVTGVDDLVDDGDRGYGIVFAAAASADPYFTGLKPGDVSVTNRDDDVTTATAVSPDAGPVAGGTALTITGAAFGPGASVTIGGVSATSVTVLSPTTISAVAGEGRAGPADIVVTNRGGAGTLVGGYTYVPPPTITALAPVSGPAAGGTSLTLTGTGFLPGATVLIGGVAATPVTVVNGTTITVTTGAGTPATVDVVVANPDSQVGTLPRSFTYVSAPRLVSISPATASVAGRVVVTLTGADFGPGAIVRLGGVAATDVAVIDSTTLRATVPPGQAGAVDVTVVNTDDQTATLVNGFTYTPNVYRYYFAEGATSGFFGTTFALFNPSDNDGEAALRYLTDTGSIVTEHVMVPARTRVTVDPQRIAALARAEFSTVVEGTVPIVVDRTMRWDASGYGGHAETAADEPNTTWYLAEGATHSGFELFYLLQNPQAAAAEVEVTYLRPAPLPPLIKQYTVQPNSRFNIWVNLDDPGLASTETSAIIRSLNDVPIIVERSMYLSMTSERVFDAGHNSMGVTAPAARWFFAEGVTGSLFDMFVLVANPTPEAADLEARYLLPDGDVVTRRYRMEARSRLTIWVDQEDVRLANTAVSVILTSLTGTPVVAERALWWFNPQGYWHEANNSPGSTETGTAWALADGEVGGGADTVTYVLVANTSPVAGSILVTVALENGTTLMQQFAVAPTSRFSIDMAAAFPMVRGRRFATMVESVGTDPVAIVVERAMYWNANGVWWAAGTDALATKLR